jgi:hypothetical protein
MLNRLKLPKVISRRLRGDMIEMLKMVRLFYDNLAILDLKFSQINYTRGNNLKWINLTAS